MADKKRKVDFTGDLRGNGLIDPETTVTYTEMKADGGKREITDYGVKDSGEAVQPNLKNQTGGNSFPSGSIGVRQFANALGFDNDKIGWGGGSDVTYNGKYLLTADENDNGVTKSGVNSLINGINDYYKREKINNSVNDVTKAVSGMGLSNAVQYGEGGVVTVAGIPVKNAVVVDGQAYAPMQDILEVVSSFKKESGFSEPQEIFKSYYEKNSGKTDDYLDEIMDFGDFEYDPESDPAYKAYREIFLHNAQNAADDAWGRNAARSGGYANSAAMAASDRAYYDEISKLNSVVPRLSELAYGKYRDSYEDLFRELGLYGTPKDLFDMEYEAKTAQNNAIQDALNADYERDADIRKFNRDIFESNRDYERDIYEDERDYNRSVYESDRDYERGVHEFDKSLEAKAPAPVVQYQAVSSDTINEKFKEYVERYFGRRQYDPGYEDDVNNYEIDPLSGAYVLKKKEDEENK